MKSTPLVRNMRERDLAELDKYFSSFSIDNNSLNKWKNHLKEQKNKERAVRVLELDGELIGIGTLKLKSDYSFFALNSIPEINDIFIVDAHQKQGYGRMLILALEDAARDLGYKKVGLGVGLYKGYGNAQRLYVKMNYVPDGNGVTYNNQPVVWDGNYKVDDDLLLWLVKDL